MESFDSLKKDYQSIPQKNAYVHLYTPLCLYVSSTWSKEPLLLENIYRKEGHRSKYTYSITATAAIVQQFVACHIHVYVACGPEFKLLFSIFPSTLWKVPRFLFVFKIKEF